MMNQDKKQDKAQRPSKRNAKSVAIMRQQPQEKLAYKPKELPRLLGLAEGTIYSLIAAGQLGSITVGHRIIVPADAVKKFLETARVQ